jgi:hypothetical protein
VLSQSYLRELADRLVAVPGVVGVMLGGSRARGEHTPDSDTDLGLYYRPSLDVGALATLARDVAGPDAEVSEPGAWGPWVDGGAWLTVSGSAVDWLYRDVDRVVTSWNDAVRGRFTFHHQVGHPLGVPDFAYAGEVALGVVLADPTGELAALKERAERYPAALADAVVERLWEADFSLANAAKATSRADVVYVAGCLFRAVELCAHALHAAAGRWLVNEKGAVAAAGRLPVAPVDFTGRAQGLLTELGADAQRLDARIRAAHQLVADVRAACRTAG